MIESLRNLEAAGWKRCTRKMTSAETWPSSARIVLERGDAVLVHTYCVYTDSSDYPGDEHGVTWREGRLVQVQLWDVEWTKTEKAVA